MSSLSPSVGHSLNPTVGGSGALSSQSQQQQRRSSILQLRRKSNVHKVVKPILGQVLAPTTPLIVDGNDVTPHALNPFVYEKTREREFSIIRDSESYAVTSMGKMESSKFKADILQQNRGMDNDTITMTRMSFLTVGRDDVFLGGEGANSSFTVRSYSASGGDIPMMMTMLEQEEGQVVDEHMPIPEHVSLILRETPTEYLLDLPSSSTFKDADEAEEVEENNRRYEFLTSARGRNRKMLEVGVQTIPVMMKARDVDGPKSKQAHHGSSVSNWELYDAHQVKARKGDEVFDDVDDDEEKLDGEHGLTELASEDSLRTPSDEKEMLRMVKSRKFLDALLVIERLLANNEYNWEQKRYKGLADPDLFRENIEYKYKLKLLWTFANDDTAGKAVVGISVNPKNEDVIAVGYGKYHPEEQTSGIVAIWNIKNPVQPEKLYKYPNPVTCVHFGRINPNVLAVGFYDGMIRVLDISNYEQPDVSCDKASFEPVWQLLWYQVKETSKEYLLAGFVNGRVLKYTLVEGYQLRSVQIMRTHTCDGKLKGINNNKCRSKEITIGRYSAVQYLTLHPSEPHIYLIGTAEGVVFKCSALYLNKYLDTIQTHDGAVTTVVYSPFVSCIFITCGNDFTLRFWLDGVHEPLIESTLEMKSLAGVSWSPSHSTIVVTISGHTIHVFDLQRKLYEPQSQTKSPTNSFNTICRFSPNGRCVMVGDKDGNVHMFSLEDLPCPAFFQANLLFESLKAITIVAKPELKKKFYKKARSYGQATENKKSEFFN